MREDKPVKPTWTFAPRFRAGAFGWRSELAITRIKEAVAEIKAVARKDPLRGAEGAVLFLQKLSPALQQVDGSSGAIGTAVNRAIEALVPVIAKAPADPALRRKWLEKLYQAHADDQIPYIETLGDAWGALCADMQIAREWADRLAETVERIWRRSKDEHGFFHGTSMALSALSASGQYERLLALVDLEPHQFWPYRLWGVRALSALGRSEEAIHYAEATRGRFQAASEIAQACEAILLGQGRADEAYARYGYEANQAGTYLATYRALCKKYPQRPAAAILADLVQRTPGEEGKWFAAAKDAKDYGLALELARASPVDHRTLLRAVHDYTGNQPEFALNCGLLALHWICAGRAYDPTALEVWSLFDGALRAGEGVCGREAVLDRVRETLAAFPQEKWVREVLAQRLG